MQINCNQEGRKEGGKKRRREKQIHIMCLSTAIAQIIFNLSTAHDATDHTANLTHRAELETAHSAK